MHISPRFHVPIAAIVFLWVSNSAGFSQNRSQVWSVVPVDGAIRLVGVEEFAGSTTLILQNESEQIVTAYSACFNMNGAHTACHDSDWFTNEVSTGLGTGDSDRLFVDDRESRQYTDKTVEISVLFEDGTSIGSKHNVSRLELHRLGRALETKRVLDVAKSFYDNDLSDSDLDDFVRQIGSVPARVDGQFVSDVLAMKQRTLPELLIPDLRIGPPILGLSLLTGVSGVRSDMLRAIDNVRKHKIVSDKPGSTTRRMYLSALIEKLRTISVRQINVCKRSRGLRS